MTKQQLDKDLLSKTFEKKEGISLSKIRDVIFRYKLMILGATIFSSCSSPDHSKSREISSNPLDKHKIAEIYGIDVFKDTLLYTEDGKYTYDYTKFKDSLNVENKIEKLNNWIDKFPPDFLEKMNLDEVFIQKKIVRTSKETGKKTTPTGLCFVKNDNLSLTNMDEFPHELVHKILEEIDFDYEEWAKDIYGENFAGFYGEPKKNEQGYYPRLTGFINNNASRSVAEDWAETIYDLIGKNNAEEFFQHDKVLQKKIKSMKKVFFELDNRFTEKYWKDIQAGKVNKQYWGK